MIGAIRYFFSGLTTTQKLLGFTGAGLAALVGCGVVVFRLLGSIETAQQEMLHRLHQVRAQGDLDMMHDAVRADVLAVQLALREGDTEAMRAERDFAEHAARARARASELRALQFDESSAAQRDAVVGQLEVYLQAAGRVVAIVRKHGAGAEQPAALAAAADGTPADWQRALQEFHQRFAQTEQSFAAFSDHISDTATQAEKVAASRMRDARRLAFAVVVAAVVLFPLLAMAIARSIVQPLHAAVAATRRIAGGDLSVEVVSTTRDEAGRLLHELRQMNGALRAMVGAVREGAYGMSEATQQIDSGSAQLSRRSAERASTLEQVASAFEEISASVKQSAEHTRESAQFAHAVTGVAVRSGELIQQAVNKMTLIAQSAAKIGEITGVIDNIAFQTNILALNAAVEAARAGQSGGGFAVVAAEVRALSSRCAAAAKEISQLIGESTRNVKEGDTLVASAGATMQEIVAKVHHLSDSIQQVSAAATQQAVAVSQVQKGVQQLESLVQQDLGLVEEGAAAAHALREQASAFIESVRVFKLPESHAARNAASNDSASPPSPQDRNPGQSAPRRPVSRSLRLVPGVQRHPQITSRAAHPD